MLLLYLQFLNMVSEIISRAWNRYSQTGMIIYDMWCSRQRGMTRKQKCLLNSDFVQTLKSVRFTIRNRLHDARCYHDWIIQSVIITFAQKFGLISWTNSPCEFGVREGQRLCTGIIVHHNAIQLNTCGTVFKVNVSFVIISLKIWKSLLMHLEKNIDIYFLQWR